MVAGGDDIDPRRIDLRRGGRGNAVAARRVFAVGHHDIQPQGLPHRRQQQAQCAAPRFAHNVASEKQLHAPERNLP